MKIVLGHQVPTFGSHLAPPADRNAYVYRHIDLGSVVDGHFSSGKRFIYRAVDGISVRHSFPTPLVDEATAAQCLGVLS